ncbi:MAG: hypothetical protein K9N47_06960 [Prosthecobacter sp.]|uniref:hypothetical protein n=1 Tax=Prosthecobacter sp. TaxID=1965333 RepID=UPI0025F7E8D5|nr:hypothetical protein [Prosthecobacter sp.]MCF7785844.1 hypothetical protein [Prosthecobacter sp.]
MAKKPAPKKAPAKKPAASKKPAAVKKKPLPVKKAAPAKKKPQVVKPKAAAKPAPAPPVKKAEPAPILKPVFEAPAPRPAILAPAPAAKVVMKTGAIGTSALAIAAQASAGAAANANSHPANILVLVSSSGWPVTDLTKDHFTLMEYFEVPGQQAPFSNNITSFRNVGTGAYLLQVKPINGAPWRTGHHLAQILVSSSDDRQGQGAVKLIIR